MHYRKLLFILVFSWMVIEAVHAQQIPLKDHLLKVVDKIIDQQRSTIQNFEYQLKNGTLKIQGFPHILRQSSKRQLEYYQKLRVDISNSTELDLPNKIVELFIKKRTETEYEELRILLLEVGENAVLPLNTHYDRSDQFVKESILNVLGEIASKNGLPTIYKSFTDPSIRVQSAGIQALRLINGAESIPQLHDLLSRTISVDLRLLILKQLDVLQDPTRCDLFFDYANQKKIPFQSLIHHHLESCHEKIIGNYPDLLLREFKNDADKTDQSFILKLVSQLESKEHIKKLFPIYTIILKEYFNIETDLNNYATTPEPGSRTSEYHRILIERVANLFTSDDVRTWLQDPRNDPFSHFYLNVLHLNKTQRSSDELLKKYYFVILNVSNDNDDVVCNNESEFKSGDQISIVCPNIHDFGPYDLSMSVKLDLVKFQIKLEGVKINLKPHPAVFNVSFPLGGSYTILLKGNDGKQYTWKFSNFIE